jgi:hypothetical protein
MLLKRLAVIGALATGMVAWPVAADAGTSVRHVVYRQINGWQTLVGTGYTVTRHQVRNEGIQIDTYGVRTHTGPFSVTFLPESIGIECHHRDGFIYADATGDNRKAKARQFLATCPGRERGDYVTTKIDFVYRVAGGYVSTSRMAYNTYFDRTYAH